VTGKLDSFATRSRIVHIDIDTAEIHKNKTAHVAICADVFLALQQLNVLLRKCPELPAQFDAWRKEVRPTLAVFPLLGFRSVPPVP
jgi:acetolactate synthase-1/2/3 large subunit